jgi:ATP-binding cassette subfamily F protein uup
MRKPVRNCSGGETNRLLLAKLFARPSNLLVLDEPTNDLDSETLELLEELLIEYEGTILLVSHDRAFLDNVVTECLVLPGDGRVIEYSGGYSDWRAREAERRAAEDGAGRAGGGARAGGTDAAPRRTKPKTDRPRTLSFREQRELDGLPDRIAALEAEQAEIHTALQDPELYRGTEDAGSEVRRLTGRLEAVEQELARAYARWEELEALPEKR